MIESIFYFPEDYNTYLANKDQISSRTIVFIKSTGQIFRNNVEYGRGSSSSSLSVASSTKLGGIMLGYTQNGKNYPVKVDADGRAYVNVAWQSGGEGGSTVENPYDDSWIEGYVTNLITNAKNELESDIDDLDNSIISKWKNEFRTYKSLINYYRDSGDTTYSDYTFGDTNCNAWASTMGLITPNADGTYNVGWSQLQQNYNSLSGRVSSIEGAMSTGSSELDYEMLSSGLYAYINDHAAESGIDATWGKFLKLSDDDIARLEWMSSGVSSYASDSQTFSKLMAAAQHYDETGKELLSEAAASVNALVEKDPATDEYVAKATLQTLVDDLTSGFLSSTDGKTAIATMFAEDGDVRSSITTLVNDEIGSAINIDADDINLNGHVWGDEITALEFASESGQDGGTVHIGYDNIIASTPDHNTTIDSERINIVGPKWMTGIVSSGMTVANKNLTKSVDVRVNDGSAYVTVTGGKVTADGFNVGSSEGINRSIETIAGTLQFTGGILTGFTAHTNNVYTQITE